MKIRVKGIVILSFALLLIVLLRTNFVERLINTDIALIVNFVIVVALLMLLVDLVTWVLVGEPKAIRNYKKIPYTKKEIESKYFYKDADTYLSEIEKKLEYCSFGGIDKDNIKLVTLKEAYKILNLCLTVYWKKDLTISNDKYEYMGKLFDKLRANQVELTVDKYKDNLEFYYKGERIGILTKEGKVL